MIERRRFRPGGRFAIARLFYLPLLGLIAAADPVPIVAQGSSSPAMAAGVPNVVIRYYDVSGTTPGAIRRALLAARPRDPVTNRKMVALTRWSIGYGWEVDRLGGCKLDSAAVKFEATTILPRLASEERVSEQYLVKWRKFVDALKRHHEGHIRPPFEHLSEVKAAIIGSSCLKAREAAESVIATLRRRDLEYDRKTRHGATEGAILPGLEE